MSADLDLLAINTIRTLSMDGVQAANSGHPGAPMALAPLAYRIYTKHMSHDPAAPEWINRDRFVLSCGHASMLLYSTLHLAGYDVTMDDLRSFRQLHSRTAGHPERGELPGIETTTGPLGQGIANAVGMALAERMLAARFNGAVGSDIVDHWTWVLASDGDMMEGVQAEAASLAGHLGLGRLVVFYDDNKITIDGTTDISFTEDVAQRYESYGWQVLNIDDVNDLAQIDTAVAAAKSDEDRPTLVVTRSHIGFGSPLQDSSKAHGAPLGHDNIATTKSAYNWPYTEPFHIPAEALSHIRTQVADRASSHAQWSELVTAAKSDATAGGALAELERVIAGDLPTDWDQEIQALLSQSPEDVGALETRKASAQAIGALCAHLPELVGGSADLAESNGTDIAGGGDVQFAAFQNRNLRFGIREHGMGAILNGMLAHGGFRVFGATFLVFSDYMRPSIRLAALMGLPAIYVFTHDSVFLGEDGPTHQPVEHMAALRAIPGLVTIRPADAFETWDAWRVALEQKDRPIALALTRQKVPSAAYGSAGYAARTSVGRGAYVLLDCDDEPDVILIGTGSEVELCIASARELTEQHGLAVRVVSMPSWELFADQDASYREQVLPSHIKARVAVEAGTTFGWERYAGDAGEIIGIDRFGLSAPGSEAAAALGLTVDNVVAAALKSRNSAGVLAGERA